MDSTSALTPSNDTATTPSVGAALDLPPVPTSAASNVPIPMSFPAVLRGPGIGHRFAHLRNEIRDTEVAAARPKRISSRRDEKEGKRWIRRMDNARFVGNPHIVLASRKDFAIPLPNTRQTFPQPLPTYLSRNNPIPAAIPTTREPTSASAGRFSLGLKGMRKELRKSGPRTELLVYEVESEIMGWLANNVWLNPDDTLTSDEDGLAIGTSGSITQVSRTALQLVWSITDDAFARYVVHCCARYHSIVSFSKDVSGRRLTYILRPNISRPAFAPAPGLNTPPVTDLESSVVDSESDFMLSDRDSHRDTSDAEIDSDVEPGPGVPPPQPFALADIPESTPGSPAVAPSALDDSWSMINESDAEADVENDLTHGVASLTLDPEVTPRAARQLRQGSVGPPPRRHALLRDLGGYL
ncbi:hypothetical protein BDW22DRAFT_1421976 [Trametopsis cervina]|nr:hypothetical protein BDW22DRAFT_1421976 [Trametopsis cervina]